MAKTKPMELRTQGLWVKHGVFDYLVDALEDCVLNPNNLTDFSERDRLKLELSNINEKFETRNMDAMVNIGHLIRGPLESETMQKSYVSGKPVYRDSETIGNLWYIRRMLGELHNWFLDKFDSFDQDTTLRNYPPELV